MKNIALVYLLFILAGFVHGQSFQFSQYNISPTRVNPAWLGLTSYTTGELLYRRQKTGGDLPITTQYAATSYPFLRQSTGTAWSGVGLSFLNDQSQQIFKTQEINVSAATNVQTGKYEFLSLGFSGVFRTQQIDPTGLSTGMQYVPDRGFDPGLSNGESLTRNRINYSTFSTGLMWQRSDRRGNLLGQAGISIFDFNQAHDSFTGSDSRLPVRMVAQSSLLMTTKDRQHSYLDMLFTSSSGNALFNCGWRLQVDLDPFARQLTNKLDVFARYTVGRSGIVGVQVQNENWLLGVSYDFPVLVRNYGNLGAMEFALQYRVKNHVRNSSRSKKTTKPKPRPTTPTVKRIPPRPTEKIPPKETKDTTQVAIAADTTRPKTQPVVEVRDSTSRTPGFNAGKISHQPIVVERITLHFHFDFNSTDLDDETEQYLTKLGDELLANPTLKIEVTGHTDDRGTERFNQRLSESRAAEVKKFLVRHGVSPERINASGKGFSEPVVGNLTEENRAKNRRVELKVYQDQ